MLECQFAATGFDRRVSRDFAGRDVAALGAKIGFKFLWHSNRITGVSFRMTETPESFRLRILRANRNDVAILANGHWSGGKIFLFFGFVPEIDFAEYLDDNLVIGASGNVDCS